jgi:hypothetical protein
MVEIWNLIILPFFSSSSHSFANSEGLPRNIQSEIDLSNGTLPEKSNPFTP